MIRVHPLTDCRVARLREAARVSGHPRSADNVAHLALGWAAYLRFAASVGAITHAEELSLWKKGWTALLQGSDDQADISEIRDPLVRAIQILRTGLAAGRGRICQYGGMGVPDVDSDELQRYGWRLSPHNGRPEPISAQAPVLGWLEVSPNSDGVIYLQAEATSHLLETSRSTSIGIYDQLGLARALDARGVLAKREKRSPILRKKGASGPRTQERYPFTSPALTV
jgi:hypothetical protein